MSYTANPDRYKNMKYNRCGKSGIKLPAISLGLWHNFGDVDDQDNARDMITTAFDLGITHFDLANNYGPSAGSAETNFGKMLSKELSAYRDELIISTKAGHYMWPGPYGDWASRKYLLASLDQSLMHMKLDYVDIFYSHRPDPETPLEETVGALAHAVQSGKALYVGISQYPADKTAQAAKMLKEMGVPCLIHQPNYSILDRWVEESLLDALEDNGIGAIAFCPLSQGLLTDKYLKEIPSDSRAAKEHGHLKEEAITKDLQLKLNKLNEIAKNRNQSLAQMSLAWVLKDKRITSALIGASRVEHIKQNIEALDNLEFTQEELKAIDNAIA